jgi:hypothetical protein
MILRCRSQGLTVGECAQHLGKNIWDNIYWIAGTTAGVTAVVVCVGSGAGVAVGTVVAVVGGVYKVVNDLTSVYYEYSSAEQAEEQLRRILRERDTWTATNVMFELSPKLAQLREKIDRTAAELAISCNNLERLVSEATDAARDAKRITDDIQIPHAIPGEDRPERFASRLEESWDELEVLEAEMDSVLGALRGAHDEAQRLVRICESREGAEQVSALVQVCESRGRDAAQMSNRAGLLLVTHDSAAETVAAVENDLQADLAAASAARDRITGLFDALSDPAVAEREAQRGTAALDLLTEPHPSLTREIRALELAFGDPEALDASVDRRFRELEERLESHRPLVDSCDPHALYRLYVDQVDEVLGSRMWVQRRIDQSASDLSRLSSDQGAAFGLMSRISEMSSEASTLVAAAQGLRREAQDCLARVESGGSPSQDDRPAAVAASEVRGKWRR